MSTAVARVIEVLLTDAEEWPAHGPKNREWTGSAQQRGNIWQKYRGTIIGIINQPIVNTDWNCDSDLLWPVLREDSDAIGATKQVYACRHQIQIGD